MERKNNPTYIRCSFAVLLIVFSLCSVIFTGCTAVPSQEEVVIGDIVTGKDFIIGFQFHPEAAVVKHLQGADNAADFMDRETALHVFEALVELVQS